MQESVSLNLDQITDWVFQELNKMNLKPDLILTLTNPFEIVGDYLRLMLGEKGGMWISLWFNEHRFNVVGKRRPKCVFNIYDDKRLVNYFVRVLLREIKDNKRRAINSQYKHVYTMGVTDFK